MPPVRFCNHTTWGHDPIELSYPCETRAATLFSRHGGPPLRERRRACRRRAFEICRPAHVFPTGPRRRRDWFPNPADMNSRWVDACDTANSARPMPGERREGRRTKRRTRHRGRVRTERGHAGCHRMAMADGGSPPWRSPDTRVSGMALTTRLGVGATRGAKPDEALLPAPTREGRRFPREPRCLPPPAARTRDEGSLLRCVRPVSDSRRPHAPRSRA